MAFELIWSNDDVDHHNVSLNGISDVETIHDFPNKVFDNYSRLILQFTKSTDTAPNPLYIDIHIKMKTGKVYPPKLQTYLVCYGVKGLQSDVSAQVYDALWGVDDGKVIMNEVIDMGNKAIIGIKADTVDTGAVTYKQLVDYVADIIKKNDYYYYTNVLNHNNTKLVRYPSINKYPFSDVNSQLRIHLTGYYHIIYTDNYKGSGKLFIQDTTAGNELFSTHLNSKSDFTPITINTVIEIVNDGSFSPYNTVHIATQSAILDGQNYSTLYIKYLNPL